MATGEKPLEIYNPVQFVRKNVSKILPAESMVKSIKFSGFIRKAFHSSDRPSGFITIIYEHQEKEHKLQLFVKQHPGAPKVFNQMSAAYAGLNAQNLEIHMPRPVICDKEKGVNYMEFVEGKALTYKVLLDLLFFRKKELVQLFNQIGIWLKHYHDASRLEKSTTLNQVKENIEKGLKNTTMFSRKEKEILSSRIKVLHPENTFLVMVKPHNDFSMRNIIYTKNEDFIVIDWDAMFHDKFRTESPIWNDIASFVINVNSLRRFTPFIPEKNLTLLTESFLNGYFSGPQAKPHNSEINNMLYLYTLKYFLGTIGDRSLNEIYHGKLGFRYIKKLRADLLEGKCI